MTTSCFGDPRPELREGRYPRAIDRERRNELSMLGRFFQTAQRLGGTNDETPAQKCLNQPVPPSWRELERSTECHAAGVGTKGRHPNHFVVDDAKGQVDLQSTLFSVDDP